MVGHKREKALSELIGFILLLALLMIVASLYLTYVVPANGREAEIAHMDYIKGQFLNYKINTDALWINREMVTIAQAITLGTQGVKTIGVFSGFQLFSPVLSTGELSIGNTNPSEKFTIQVINPLYSPSYSSANPGYEPQVISESIFSDSGNLSINRTPDHLYLNFSTSKITHREATPEKIRYYDFPKEYGAKILGNDFQIVLKAVPQYLTRDFNWTYQFLTPDINNEYWIRYRTDLLLSITKNNINILDNYPVYTNIKNISEGYVNYTVDILNPAYGFVQQDNDFSFLQTRKYDDNSSEGTDNFIVGSRAISGYVNLTSDPSTPVTLHPISGSSIDTSDRFMGRLEYESHNVYYRTQQNFIYQMGGIFVSQTEGSSPLNMPLITVKQPDIESLNINITDISLSGDTAVSGSSPVQVQTTLSKIRGSALDTTQANAASVVLKVENTDLPDLWRLIFNAVRKNAGSSAEENITVTSDQNSATMNIDGPVSGNITRDITVIVTYVDYDVELDAVGKTTGI